MTQYLHLGTLAEELSAEKLRQLHVRGFLVLDDNALPVASTFHNPAFEEQVCGLAAKVLELLAKSKTDLELSESLYLWLAGVERNLAVIPLANRLYLVAVCDPAASPAATLVPLLTFGQRLLVRALAAETGAGHSRAPNSKD